jgi:hypothetical protein
MSAHQEMVHLIAKMNIPSLCNLHLSQSIYKENDFMQQQVSPSMASRKRKLIPMPQQILF